MANPQRIVRLVRERQDPNGSGKEHQAQQPGQHANEEGEDVVHEVFDASINENGLFGIVLIVVDIFVSCDDENQTLDTHKQHQNGHP